MSCHHLSQESARSEKRARFYSTWLDKDNHSLGFIQPNLIRQPFSGLPSPQNRGGQWWSSRQTPGRPDKGPALLGEGGKVFSMWEKSRQNSWRTNCDFLWNPFFSVQLLLGSRRQEVMHWCAQVDSSSIENIAIDEMGSRWIWLLSRYALSLRPSQELKQVGGKEKRNVCWKLTFRQFWISWWKTAEQLRRRSLMLWPWRKRWRWRVKSQTQVFASNSSSTSARSTKKSSPFWGTHERWNRFLTLWYILFYS